LEPTLKSETTFVSHYFVDVYMPIDQIKLVFKAFRLLFLLYKVPRTSRK